MCLSARLVFVFVLWTRRDKGEAPTCPQHLTCQHFSLYPLCTPTKYCVGAGYAGGGDETYEDDDGDDGLGYAVVRRLRRRWAPMIRTLFFFKAKANVNGISVAVPVTVIGTAAILIGNIAVPF